MNGVSSPIRLRSGFGQAAIGVPGAVAGTGVRYCAFEACDVSHIGNYGIELSHGCQKNRIARCTLTDLGAGGVKLGEVAIRSPENEQTFGNELSDCTIADGGNLFPSCVAVWVGQSHDNTIAHNDIHGFPVYGDLHRLDLGLCKVGGPAEYRRVQPYPPHRHKIRRRFADPQRHGLHLYAGRSGRLGDPFQPLPRRRGPEVWGVGNLLRRGHYPHPG